MKAILVIDMPDVCCSTNETCDLCVDKDWGPICAKTGRDVLWGQKPDWCPLRPLPEECDIRGYKPPKSFAPGELDLYVYGILTGWNGFRAKLLGEVEE